MASISSSGFNKRSLEEIVLATNTEFRNTFGINFDVTPEGADGQTIGIVSKLIHDAEEDAEAAYNSASPSKSFGVGLDYNVEYNGIHRIVNRNCGVMLDVAGDAGTQLPAGALASTASGLKFATEEAVELPNSVYAVCTTAGQLNVNIGEVIRVDPQYKNWKTVSNRRAGDEGVVYEKDSVLRARRSNALVAGGAGTTESLTAALYKLGATYANVIDNDTGAVVNGQPSASFQVVIDGGSDRTIAKAIYSKRITGIKSYGSTTVTLYDSQGFPRPISFTRPTLKRVFATVTAIRMAGAPTDPQPATAAALQGVINLLQPAQSIEWAALFAPVIAVGGLRVTNITLGFAATGQKAETLSIGATERANILPADVKLVIS